MTEHQPLTAESLRQFAADERALQDGLAEDCQALEDVMVRLAGPTLQGIEEDTARLEELQGKLAAPALEGIKRDMQRITRMLRKLATPIEQSIAEDTTMLTGIAARAHGSTFPPNTRSASNPGMRANPGTMGASGAHSTARPAGARRSAPGMGVSGAAPVSSPIGGAGHTAGGNPSQHPVFAVSAQSGVGGSLQQSIPIEDIDAPAAPLSYGRPAFGVSPFAPPSPGSQFPGDVPAPAEPEPDLTVTSGASGGGTVALGVDYTAPLPAPAPPPPLPQPPPRGCDLCEAVMHLADVMGGQLSAIAQALYVLRPDVRASVGFSGITDDIRLQWTDPAGQAIIDNDSKEAAVRLAAYDMETG